MFCCMRFGVFPCFARWFARYLQRLACSCSCSSSGSSTSSSSSTSSTSTSSSSSSSSCCCSSGSGRKGREKVQGGGGGYKYLQQRGRGVLTTPSCAWLPEESTRATGRGGHQQEVERRGLGRRRSKLAQVPRAVLLAGHLVGCPPPPHGRGVRAGGRRLQL